MGRAKPEPNEITEMWREHRHDLQERRADRRERRTQEIFALAADGYHVKPLTPYQFRINGKLDLYPTCNRYHNLVTQKRGSYQELKFIVRLELHRATLGVE